MEEATVTDYFPHTQGRDGVFFVSESRGEKSLHSRRGDANAFHAVSHALTHSSTYLSDRTWLCTYFSINPPKNKQRPLPPLLPLGFFLVFLSSPAFLFPLLPSSLLSFLPSPSPSFSAAAGRSVHTQTHGSRRAHSSLPLPLAISFSPSPHSRMHTLGVAARQLPHRRKLLSDPLPYHFVSPLCPSLSLSLSLSLASLNVSPPR